jgi:hypothetical protein
MDDLTLGQKVVIPGYISGNYQKPSIFGKLIEMQGSTGAYYAGSIQLANGETVNHVDIYDPQSLHSNLYLTVIELIGNFPDNCWTTCDDFKSVFIDNDHHSICDSDFDKMIRLISKYKNLLLRVKSRN